MRHPVLLALLCTLTLAAQPSVVTDRYGNGRTSANLEERILTTANVNSRHFGKLFQYRVNGAVFAQPLYLPHVEIPGRGFHNVIYIATMEDQIYAFDADHPGDPLWLRDLTDPAAGITPVPVADITGDNNLNIVGNVGILSTPVIDPSSGALYLVARTKGKRSYSQRLYSLDVHNGRDLVPSALIRARIESLANDAIDGYLYFNSKTNNQRPALTFANGQILIAWASHEDLGPYHGWIMAYDAKTLTQTAVLCITPEGSAGGVWQSGRGAAVDREGNIYYETGNGDFGGTTNFGESLLKLRIENGKFVIADSYTPGNFAELNKQDADFGSTGPLLIPGTNWIVCGNKHGQIVLLDTRNLGKPRPAVQTVEVNGGLIFGGPAWYGKSLYLWPMSDVLKKFAFDGQRFDPTPAARGKIASHGSPGGALAISANGSKPGSAIVWAMLSLDKDADHGKVPGILRAFDAESLEELWNSEQNPARDRSGTLIKFVPPVVVNGKVYAPSYDNAVNVYGLLE